MNNFYVYAYFREDGTPYYIGKGTGNRAWTKGKNEIRKPTDKERISILKEKLTNEEAKQLEIQLIEHYGRKDLETGILRNKTFGGDGAILIGEQNGMFGRTGEKHHHYGKKRLDVTGENNAMYGRRGENHPAYGYRHSVDCRLLITESKLGVKRINFDQSGEKNPMFGKKGKDNPMFGKSHSKIECPHCGTFTSNAMYSRWHGDNCKKKDDQ